MRSIARLQRPGWDARWGNEEKDRVEGAFAGAIAVEGAAAGFATAGGLDAKVEGTPVEGADAAAATSSDEPLVDESLPDDVSELRELVSGRWRSLDITPCFPFKFVRNA